MAGQVTICNTGIDIKVLISVWGTPLLNQFPAIMPGNAVKSRSCAPATHVESRMKFWVSGFSLA